MATASKAAREASASWSGRRVSPPETRTTAWRKASSASRASRSGATPGPHTDRASGAVAVPREPEEEEEKEEEEEPAVERRASRIARRDTYSASTSTPARAARVVPKVRKKVLNLGVGGVLRAAPDAPDPPPSSPRPPPEPIATVARSRGSNAVASPAREVSAPEKRRVSPTTPQRGWLRKASTSTGPVPPPCAECSTCPRRRNQRPERDPCITTTNHTYFCDQCNVLRRIIRDLIIAFS